MFGAGSAEEAGAHVAAVLALAAGLADAEVSSVFDCREPREVEAHGRGRFGPGPVRFPFEGAFVVSTPCDDGHFEVGGSSGHANASEVSDELSVGQGHGREDMVPPGRGKSVLSTMAKPRIWGGILAAACGFDEIG